MASGTTAEVHARHKADVPWILVHVFHENRFCSARRTDDSLTDFEAKIQSQVERITFRVRDAHS